MAGRFLVWIKLKGNNMIIKYNLLSDDLAKAISKAKGLPNGIVEMAIVMKPNKPVALSLTYMVTQEELESAVKELSATKGGCMSETNQPTEGSEN